MQPLGPNIGHPEVNWLVMLLPKRCLRTRPFCWYKLYTHFMISATGLAIDPSADVAQSYTHRTASSAPHQHLSTVRTYLQL